MKNQTVCFTGHRMIPPEQRAALSRRLRAVLIQLIKEGYRYFGAGGALGFDTLAAQTVLELKALYPDIKLILVLPCKSQADGWQERDRRIYEQIKRCADKVRYTAEQYYAGCMHLRNRHLVDHSSVCVCYLTASKGGTFYTVSYAKSNRLRVINVAQQLC